MKLTIDTKVNSKEEIQLAIETLQKAIIINYPNITDATESVAPVVSSEMIQPVVEQPVAQSAPQPVVEPMVGMPMVAPVVEFQAEEKAPEPMVEMPMMNAMVSPAPEPIQPVQQAPVEPVVQPMMQPVENTIQTNTYEVDAPAQLIPPTAQVNVAEPEQKPDANFINPFNMVESIQEQQKKDDDDKIVPY